MLDIVVGVWTVMDFIQTWMKKYHISMLCCLFLLEKTV